MKSVYESIMTGLNEAIEDAQSEGKKLNRRTVTIIPVKEYGAEQVRNIRNSVGMSQSTFAGYLGVSKAVFFLDHHAFVKMINTDPVCSIRQGNTLAPLRIHYLPFFFVRSVGKHGPDSLAVHGSPLCSTK